MRQGGALGAGANLLASIPQALVWSNAPSGDAELAELTAKAAALQGGADQRHSASAASLRQRG